MNNAALKYKLYTHMLEGHITRKQHDILLEIGFLEKIKSWLGGSIDVGKDLGKKIAKPAYTRQFDAAKKGITQGVKDLKDIAAKADITEEEVALFLKGVLDGAGAPDPAQIAAAKPDDGGGDKGDDGGGTPKGKPIDTGDPAAAVPALAAAAAQAAGQDEEKAKEQAEEKKVTPDKATEVLAKAIASKAGVEPKAAVAIIKALIDTGHMLAEGRRRKLYVFDFKNAINELKEMRQHAHVFDRWSSLAGISTPRRTVLKEGRTGDILNDIKAGKIKSLEELEKAIEEATKDGKGQKVLDRKEEIMAAFKEKVPDVKPEDEKAAEAAIDDAAKGGGGDKEDAKATEEAKKKFGAAFEDVKKKVGDAADEAAIAKVLDALDELDSLKIG